MPVSSPTFDTSSRLHSHTIVFFPVCISTSPGERASKDVVLDWRSKNKKNEEIRDYKNTKNKQKNIRRVSSSLSLFQL